MSRYPRVSSKWASYAQFIKYISLTQIFLFPLSIQPMQQYDYLGCFSDSLINPEFISTMTFVDLPTCAASCSSGQDFVALINGSECGCGSR